MSTWCTATEQLPGRPKAALNDRCVGHVYAGILQAYGVDPSFNSRSSLYRSGAFQWGWQFFNSSKNSSELSSAGAPFAFFPRSARGYNDGFPVFFPVCVQPPSVPVPHVLLALQSTLPTGMFTYPGYLCLCVCRCKSQVQQYRRCCSS
jgi:hypothetical protein